MISPALFSVFGLQIFNIQQTPDTSFKYDCELELETEFSGENYTYLGSEYEDNRYTQMFMMGAEEDLTVNCILDGFDCPGGAEIHTYLDLDEKRIDTGEVFILKTSGYYKFHNIFGGDQYISLSVLPKLPFNILNFRVDNSQNEISFSVYSAEKSTKFFYGIYNISGLEILKGDVNIVLGENIYQLKLPDMSQGIYIIRFLQDDNAKTFKFII